MCICVPLRLGGIPSTEISPFGNSKKTVDVRHAACASSIMANQSERFFIYLLESVVKSAWLFCVQRWDCICVCVCETVPKHVMLQNCCSQKAFLEMHNVRASLTICSPLSYVLCGDSMQSRKPRV